VSDRETMLTRIREAVAAGGTDAPEIPRSYAHDGQLPRAAVVDLLVDRLLDYKAEVVRCSSAEVIDAVARLVAGARIVVPAGLPDDVLAGCQPAAQLTVDGELSLLTAAELDQRDAVVTTAAVAMAVTGTIVLDGSAGQGRRIITLVPDRHVVVLTADRIVETVPEAIARLDPTAPLTMISGPSATSDIELSRVEGVHGPRTLQVIITD
jgi:L-lactate dehydrogenase complex protein LldG